MQNTEQLHEENEKLNRLDSKLFDEVEKDDKLKSR